MTQDLSVWHLVMNASVFVQVIMGLLLLASVISWFMIVQRMFYFAAGYRALRSFENEFWSGTDLGQLYSDGSAKVEKGRGTIGLESIFRAGFKEFMRLREQGKADADAIMEGAQRAMRVALSREEESMDKHLPFLATVGSTSPYVGLLGTVWGIMGSFQGLANVHQATLAAVAPGISEALVATAMGLFAAIPAVVAYNRFSAKADHLGNQYATFAEEFSSLLHRQVHAH
ncbi:MAG: protein TolQ [Oceanisphaera sp.]|nr:protein TolQ [Oceanisphaera sp.]